MIKAFLFILSIVTADGQLQLRAIEVEACPVKETFAAAMNEMKDKGELLAWNAACYKLPAPVRGA